MAQPEKTFRLGSVSVSIFKNEVAVNGGTREMRSISLQRRYRDGETWKSSGSTTLNPADLLSAARLLEQAALHLMEATD